MTTLDGDNVNNVLIVPDAELSPEDAQARHRIRQGGDLTDSEREKIQKILLSMPVNKHSTSAPANLSP
jgi:hypothetical protein